MEIAETLAQVANRVWYQPEQIRQLCQQLERHLSGASNGGTLIGEGLDSGPFKLNCKAIASLGLTGRVLLSILPDLWMVDLGQGTSQKLVAGKVSGPASWSSDGSLVAIPSIPSQTIRNSEAIRVLDLNSQGLDERLRVGHYLCWSSDGVIYANSLQEGGYQVHGIRPDDPKYRRVLQLPAGALVACIDRKQNRILIGDQLMYSKENRRVLSIFRLNDEVLDTEDVAQDLLLSEWTAPAFSPDGKRISLPVEEGGGGCSSLYIIALRDSQKHRLTPPDGKVQSSCWSPDGSKVAFMWLRWGGDPVRLWVVDVGSGQLEPVVEGPFADLNALGCHAWAPGSA